MALQMQYVSRKPLGFEKENRIIIPLIGRDLVSRIPTLKKELLKNSQILGITHTSMKFGQDPGKVNYRGWNGDEVTMFIMYVDDNFFGMMGMEMASGRDFSKNLLTDVGRSVIANEAMVKKMGWDEPLGQHLAENKVIGVVKDFNFVSLHSPVEPMGIERYKDMAKRLKDTFGEEPPMLHMTLHISDKNRSETLAFLEEKFTEFDPEHVFKYEFLEDILDAHYLSEKRLIKLIGSFGGICIFVSCLGLFGLSAFTTEQRTKEIGIRKVLGASTWRIIRRTAGS
jgi:putative ABC transport system permease protein